MLTALTVPWHAQGAHLFISAHEKGIDVLRTDPVGLWFESQLPNEEILQTIGSGKSVGPQIKS